MDHQTISMVHLTERDSTSKASARVKRPHVKVRTGCITCKNRRIKCDETRPQCLRCCKAGWACEGYRSAQIWVFEPQTQSSPAQSMTESTEPSEDDEQPARVKTISRFRILTEKALAEGTPISGPKLNLSSVYRDPLLGSLLERWSGPTPLTMKASAGDKVSQDGSLMPVAGSWPMIGCNASKSSDGEFLVTAMVSLASCLLGIQENDPAMTANGLRGYQIALRQIRKVLDPVAAKTIDSVEQETALIAACMACALTEYMACLSLTNADSHLDGVSMIIKRAGPSRLHDKSFRQLFLDHRSIYIGVCFATSRSMFYSNKEWIEGSWRSTDVSANTFMQKLCDIGYTTLPLLEEYDRKKDHHDEKSLWHFSERASAFDQELTQWHQDILAALPPSAIHMTRSTSKAFPLQVEFPGLGIATSIRYFHAMKIYVAFLILAVAQDLQRKGTDTTQWIIDVTETVLEHARIICQSMEYLYNKTHRAVGISTSMFPLDTAWQAFEKAEEVLHIDIGMERKWFVVTAARNKAAGFKLFREPWVQES